MSPSRNLPRIEMTNMTLSFMVPPWDSWSVKSTHSPRSRAYQGTLPGLLSGPLFGTMLLELKAPATTIHGSPERFWGNHPYSDHRL